MRKPLEGKRVTLTRRRSVPYQVVVADPAWKFGDALPGTKRGALSHYDVMSLENIKAFPLPPIADDAILFLWRVSAMVEEAYEVCRAWGFEPKTEIVWVKIGKGVTHPSIDGAGLSYGMGRYVRGCHETCIVARKGKFKVADAGHRSVFFAERREHSEKPDEFYQIVDRVVGNAGPRLDLFAGKPRPKYTSFGELGRMAKHVGSTSHGQAATQAR